MIELKYIDRRKRRILRTLQLSVFGPFQIFFLTCIYAKYGQTLPEQFLGLETYWRTIGWFGLITFFVLDLFLWKFMIDKNGKIRFSESKIEVESKRHFESYSIAHIEDLVLSKDVPYKNDERSISQKASRINFNYLGEKIDLEFRMDKKSDFEAFLAISEFWKSRIAGYKVKYI